MGAPAGMTAEQLTSDVTILWGPPQLAIQLANVRLGSAAVDAGNTPTTTLRAGLLLGRKTSDGLLYQYDPTASDGTERYVGVLGQSISMLDSSGSAEAKNAGVVYGVGLFKASKLYVLGTLLSSSSYKLVARKQMQGSGVLLDDDIPGLGRYMGLPVSEKAKTADYTVVAADHGTLFTTLGAAGAVNFTLPALATNAGFCAEFLALADQNMTVTSAEGDNIVWDNDLSADSLAFSTATHKIGGRLRFVANAAGTKWLVQDLSPATCTVTAAT